MERALTYTARNLRPASKCFFSTEICLSLHNCIDCSFSFLHSCTILWYIMCYRKSILVNYSYLVVHCPLAIQETRQPVAPYPPQRRRYLKQRRRWCCVARPSRLIGWSSWRFRPPSLREFQWIEGLGFWCFFLWISRKFHDFFVWFLLVWVGQVYKVFVAWRPAMCVNLIKDLWYGSVLQNSIISTCSATCAKGLQHKHQTHVPQGGS